MKTISAADANHHFSRLLNAVSGGESVTVLSRGKPVAVLSPAAGDATERKEARRKLLTRLHSQTPTGEARDWRRDDLYGDTLMWDALILAVAAENRCRVLV
ncbi:MAG: type II toxin-antitoxin system prevent-host-death family antitoxin [Zoogloeaceae bacterium]|jgi:prevent-host-death family protein|nr:type II toxin-antitoxin system prevent-host-death family antitoxin [Zoogloeaceae bacterium]